MGAELEWQPHDSTRGLGVSARLNGIRDALGLEAGGHDEKQKAALPKVVEWLKTGASDASVAVSAAQLLLVDGELSSPVVDCAAAPLRELLVDEWGNLAKPGEWLLALKVLVLAARDEGTFATDGHRAFSLAGSAWRALPQRQTKLRPYVSEWLHSAARTSQALGVTSWKSVEVLREQLTAADEKVFTETLTTLRALMNASGNVLTPEVQEKLFAALTPLAKVRSVAEALRASLMLWAPRVDENVRDAASQTDLLWWGQARYCTHRGTPLRHLGSDGAKRWWAAYEVARFARPWQAEPVASFVVETLADLGVDPVESRSLGAWLRDLDAVLREEGSHVPALSEKIADHVGECAVGLPITWLRADDSAAFDATIVAEATALDLESVVPAWQWTSWLVRESMLERLVG